MKPLDIARAWTQHKLCAYETRPFLTMPPATWDTSDHMVQSTQGQGKRLLPFHAKRSPPSVPRRAIKLTMEIGNPVV